MTGRFAHCEGGLRTRIAEIPTTYIATNAIDPVHSPRFWKSIEPPYLDQVDLAALAIIKSNGQRLLAHPKVVRPQKRPHLTQIGHETSDLSNHATACSVAFQSSTNRYPRSIARDRLFA